MPADKLNLVVVWREAPQFSPRERAALAWTEALTLLSERRQRRGLCAGECGVLGKGTGLSHVGGRLDQCLEQVRRRLSLDAAGAEDSGRRGSFVELASPLARLRGGSQNPQLLCNGREEPPHFFLQICDRRTIPGEVSQQASLE